MKKRGKRKEEKKKEEEERKEKMEEMSFRGGRTFSMIESSSD